MKNAGIFLFSLSPSYHLPYSRWCKRHEKFENNTRTEIKWALEISMKNYSNVFRRLVSNSGMHTKPIYTSSSIFLVTNAENVSRWYTCNGIVVEEVEEYCGKVSVWKLRVVIQKPKKSLEVLYLIEWKKIFVVFLFPNIWNSVWNSYVIYIPEKEYLSAFLCWNKEMVRKMRILGITSEEKFYKIC